MKRKKKKNKSFSGKMITKIRESPINYMSDLFIFFMVTTWVMVIAIMIPFAAYSTIINQDNSIWSEIQILVGIPLSCGGAIWMIKNSVQHAIANKNGERAHMDFPKVNAEGEDDGVEEALENG